jgi:formylglycine-generating enzyme required for sulfatase activity
MQMQQHTIFCRLGPVFLALFISLAGCSPTETIYIEAPVNGPETGPIETPEEDGETSDEQPQGITGFAFTQVNPLRAYYSVKGKTAGRLSDPIGGTAPFIYALAAGDGKNDTDNVRFAVSGNSLKIQADRLGAGVYFVYLKVTDSMGVSHAQAATVTVIPDPAALDQETRTVGGLNFKMRFVPSGAFMKPDPMDPVGDRDLMVSISTGFWIAETETTQELYQLIMRENPSLFKYNPAAGEAQSRRPVDNLLWYETVLFCNRLSLAAGREPVYGAWGILDFEEYIRWAIDTKSDSAESNIYMDEKANGYRLPTTSEWAWACIGADVQNTGRINTTGVKKHYSGGPIGSDTGIENFAWYYFNSGGITHEVGKKSCNELGLFDMTGNVAEWTWNSAFAGFAWETQGTFPISEYVKGIRSVPFERWSVCGVRIVSNQ